MGPRTDGGMSGYGLGWSWDAERQRSWRVMGFTEEELAWAAYAGRGSSARPYRDVPHVVPFDAFGGLAAAVCLFNPIRDKATGLVVPWSTLDSGQCRQGTVKAVERAANTIDPTWNEHLEAPLIGAPDPLCWAVLDEVLPHGPVKACLFPMNEANELELDWPSLAARLTTNDYDTPVLWWDSARTFIVATPYESVLTYVCGSVSLAESITGRSGVESNRIV
jgi:hypothetical protein